MATQLYRVPTQNNLQYTLGSQLAQGASTAVLNTDVTGIVRAPGVFVVDRVDSSGNKTPTAREYISFTGQSTTNLTGLSKGLAGSTDQLHGVGAIVEFIPDVVWADALYQVQTREHDVYGVHSSLPSISNMTALNIAVQSNASIQTLNVNTLNINNLAVPSLASIQQANIWNAILSSGASGQFLQNPGGSSPAIWASALATKDQTHPYQIQFGTWSLVSIAANADQDITLNLPNAWPNAHIGFFGAALPVTTWSGFSKAGETPTNNAGVNSLSQGTFHYKNGGTGQGIIQGWFASIGY